MNNGNCADHAEAVSRLFLSCSCHHFNDADADADADADDEALKVAASIYLIGEGWRDPDLEELEQAGAWKLEKLNNVNEPPFVSAKLGRSSTLDLSPSSASSQSS